MDHYQQIVEALKEPRLSELLFVLGRAVDQRADTQLQIYAGAVLGILNSPFLRSLAAQNRSIVLPLERAPYSALLSYCRTRSESSVL